MIKKIQNRKVLLLAIMLMATLSACAQKYEVRAVWLTTIGGIDWPRSHQKTAQQRELCNMLDQLKKAGINTVLLQTRVRASTIFPSNLEPFDMCLTGQHGRSPGYDPLQFAIDECHRRGMECHAWIVTIPIGKTSESRFKEFRSRHPELVKVIGQEGYMNPELPATGDYLAQFCAEVTQRYDVDGIHLDYIRYPETWPKGKGRKTNADPSRRRGHITSIVRKIHQAVKSLKPWVKLSCSPIGKSGDLSRYRSGGWNAYTAVNQDAQGWLREGLMDQLYPMMYFRGNNFYPFALDWQERSHERTIVAGLGIYFLSPDQQNWPLVDITRELHFLRDNGLGHCYFRAKFLTDNTKGLYSFIRDFDNAPALIPPMTWMSDKKPAAPRKLNIQRGSLSDSITWDTAIDRATSSHLLYNIYASTTANIDINEPRNLVATRLSDSCLVVPHSQGQHLYYAVTAVNRYGNESQARTEKRVTPKTRTVKPLTPLDTKIPPFYFRWTKKQRRKMGM